MKRRVVITGMGTINALAHNTRETMNALYQEQSGIDEITLFDTTNMKVKLACEVKDYHPEDYFSPKERRTQDRFIDFGRIAAKEAFEMAHLKDFDPYKLGVIVSSGIGGLKTIEENYDKGLDKGFDRISPYFIPMTITNLAAGQIAIDISAKGLAVCPVSACSSSANAIGDAFRQISDGYLDYALAGGCEASITKLGIGGFTSMKALTRSHNKIKASIPFDIERSGFVMGEGAGMLFLEEYEHAKNRNAIIYGEIVGYGVSCDAYHMTSPKNDGEGAIYAMKQALESAHLSAHDIDYINAHGTSTKLNDDVESKAINSIFSHNVYVSSTKSSLGHCLGAAGAIEGVICINALNNQKIPPNINTENRDPECHINLVTHTKDAKLHYVMSNSLGFGGHNVSLIFKR